MKYIIAAPFYNENAGGTIVLHRLCHLLNEQGMDASLVYYSMGEYKDSHLKRFLRFFVYLLGLRKIELNKDWNTKRFCMWKKIFNPHLKNYIVVYPEVTVGNPLKAKNVVRLFMHNPGYFTDGRTDYGTGELLFRFSDSFARDYVPVAGSKLSKELITVSTTPKCYNTEGAATERKGTAYLIRKGKNKKIIHDLKDSIKIDGFSHEKCAEVFKRVKTFISYDAVTAYSRFAVMCGCHSVIILGDDETPETYRPKKESRCYVDFGLTETKVDMEKAVLFLKEKTLRAEEASKENVRKFIRECEEFFE